MLFMVKSQNDGFTLSTFKHAQRQKKKKSHLGINSGEGSMALYHSNSVSGGKWAIVQWAFQRWKMKRKGTMKGAVEMKNTALYIEGHQDKHT